MNNTVIIQQKTDIKVQLSSFIMEITATKSDMTVRSYKSKLMAYVEWYKAQTIVKTIKDTLISYKQYLMIEFKSAKSINSYLSIVRVFYNYLYENDFINSNPSKYIKNIKDSVEPTKSGLSDEQLQELMEYLHTKKLRDRVLIILSISNGLRANELCNIKVEDFSVKDGNNIIYLLRKGYSTKSNYTILSEPIYQMLMEFIGTKEDGYIFTNSSGERIGTTVLSRAVKNIFKHFEWGYKAEYTLHSLRHTFTRLQVISGTDIFSLSKALNHKNIATTNTYVQSIKRSINAPELKVLFKW